MKIMIFQSSHVWFNGISTFMSYLMPGVEVFVWMQSRGQLDLFKNYWYWIEILHAL